MTGAFCSSRTARRTMSSTNSATGKIRYYSGSIAARRRGRPALREAPSFGFGVNRSVKIIQ